METLSCVAHAHWCFHSNSVMTVKSRQHFRASTNRASHQPLTEKIPKGKRSKVWLYFAQKDSNIATCSKCNKTFACREKEVTYRSATGSMIDCRLNGDASKTKPSLLKGKYKFMYPVGSNNKIKYKQDRKDRYKQIRKW